MKRLLPIAAAAAMFGCSGVNEPSVSARVEGGGWEVVHGWAQLPEGLPALGHVPGVGVDSKNQVFVFHRGKQPILCFDGATGKLIRSWGDDLILNAHGLEVDREDNVWVTDIGAHQVHKFSNTGQLLASWGTREKPGEDATHFNRPTDVAVAANGDFFVSDGYGNNRVVKFSADGKFVKAWGKKGSAPGEFDLPHGISVDNDGKVYVADRANGRVQVFDSDGQFLDQWKSADIGRPWGLEAGADGFLYVADGGDLAAEPQPGERNHIVKLDLKGNFVEKWGSFGYYDGQFNWLHDVAVAPDGEVYVGDIKGMRVQKFRHRH